MIHLTGLDSGGGGSGYQGGPVPDFNSWEFKKQKEGFFDKKQQENAMRRE